jgi:pilus assembly protein CpaB
MNRRLLTILLVAFVIASVCTFLVYRILGHMVVASKPVPTTRVVAAATDIKLGTVLTSSDLTTIEIAGSMPKGALLKPEQALNRGVIADIYQGEPILESRLAPAGSGGGLAATIPQGMRAAAVRVDEGVAGFVTPGMRVDVLVSGTPPGATAAQSTVTRTVLQNIAVLSAGTDIQKDAAGKPQQVQVVNLLVTPDQAETLSLASQLKIQLVLRNPLDTKIAAVPSTAMGSLFADQNPTPQPQRRVVARPAPKPAVPQYSIQVINGSSTTEEKFSSPEGQH